MLESPILRGDGDGRTASDFMDLVLNEEVNQGYESAKKQGSKSPAVLDGFRVWWTQRKAA